MPLEDKHLRRRCERELAKFPFDMSRVNIRALNNIIYLEGRIRIMRGAADARGANLERELDAAQEVLMGVPSVKEVVMTNLIRDH